MCGIGGVRAYGGEPITEEELKILLCSLQRRGNHASGIALMTDGEIFVHKAPTPAWSFVADAATNKFLEDHLTADTTMAIVHTRFATIGNPQHNPNNHPIFNGHTAIVHNGGISNHGFLFNSEKVERACETDSDIIRAILDRDGLSEGGLKTLNRMTGSAAIAAFSEDNPEVLLLARSGSPLAYGTTETKLWWASEMSAIQRAVKPWTNHHGLMARKARADVSYFTMPDNTAYLIPAENTGPIIRKEFKSCFHYNAPDYSRLQGENYGNRFRGWRAETRRSPSLPALPALVDAAPRRIKIGPCPNIKCGKPNHIKYLEKFVGKTCHACHASLASLDNDTAKVTVEILEPED